jgi:hypothetical protein
VRNDRPASPLVLRATVIASRAVRTFVAAGHMLQHTFEQAVLHGTTPAERQQITIALYDQTKLYADRAPFAWERPWFTTALGDPVATHQRVLVLAGGGGCESELLAGMGWPVVHTDASVALVELARGRLLTHTRVHACLPLTFQQVADHGEGQGVRLPTALHGPFAGVVIGWGALSHLPAVDARSLLAGIGRLAPTAPILASVMAMAPSAPVSRGARWGRHLGRQLAWVRAVTPSVDSADRFYPHVGYAHAWSDESLQTLAAAVDRRWVRDSPDGHAIFGRFLPLEAA